MDYAPRPVDSRLRGNDGPVVGLSFSPSPLIPLPSRERGKVVVLSWTCCLPARLTSGLRIKSAMTVLVGLRGWLWVCVAWYSLLHGGLL